MLDDSDQSNRDSTGAVIGRQWVDSVGDMRDSDYAEARCASN